MRRARIVIVGLAASGLVAAMAGSASALTLGTTTPPGGAAAGKCAPGAFYAQATTDSSYQYSVPVPGGAIASWSVNTAGATAGTQLALLVLRQNGAEYTVVGADGEMLPSPLPVSEVATFKLAVPITVNGGDLLGLYAPAGTLMCYFKGGSLLPADAAIAGGPIGPPNVGASYAPLGGGGEILINVAGELVQSQDAAVTASATPPAINVGGAAEYAFTVSNGGVASQPITLTDTIPSGLTVLAAASGSGSCATAAQTVTCTISGLAAGSSTPVSIIVSASGAGGFVDAATVVTPLSDPNPANNSAAARLTVNAPATAPAPTCRTVRLAGAPLAVAKVVVRALSCRLGKVTKKASRTVRRGLVITTRPGPGATLAAGSAVNIVVSSGPPRKHGKNRKGH